MKGDVGGFRMLKSATPFLKENKMSDHKQVRTHRKKIESYTLNLGRRWALELNRFNCPETIVPYIIASLKSEEKWVLPFVEGPKN